MQEVKTNAFESSDEDKSNSKYNSWLDIKPLMDQ